MLKHLAITGKWSHYLELNRCCSFRVDKYLQTSGDLTFPLNVQPWVSVHLTLSGAIEHGIS